MALRSPLNGKVVELQAEAVEKAGFDTFMMKEIHEQPRVLRNLLKKHVSEDGTFVFPDLNLDEEMIRNLHHVILVSCGTAYYAAFYGRLMLEQFTTISAEVDLGSEFRYRNPKFDTDTLVVAVTPVR